MSKPMNPQLEIRRERLALQYIIKLKANPGNPTNDVVFNSKNQNLYADIDSATDALEYTVASY